jgi:hypothetical protein
MSDLLEFVEQLQGWHDNKVENLKGVIENIKEGVFLKVGENGEQIELNAEQALWFKGGLEVALGEFEELPFKLTQNNDNEDDAD